MSGELILGDCFEVLPTLVKSGVLVDAVMCDPPYVIDYAAWDRVFEINKAVRLCKELLKPDGNVLLFQGWSKVAETKLLLDNYLDIQNWIIYDRIKGRGAKKNLVSTREDILWYCNGNKPTYNKIYSNIPKKTKGMGEKNGQENRALTNVWYDIPPLVPWGKEKVEHPTQKPLALMKRMVEIFTNEGDLILDFCAGSGTTLLAAKELGRRYIGIEIDKRYYEIAKKRLDGEL